MNKVMTTSTPTTQRPDHDGEIDRFIRPRASVIENADAVVLELEMPGVGRDKVDITVHNDELTVTGHRRKDNFEGVSVIHQERLPLDFRRQFVLSDRIDGGKITAAYENGVVKLTLPKSEGAKPKKIMIQ